jgi:hypothetical protein
VRARLQDTTRRVIPSADVQVDGTDMRALTNDNGEATIRISANRFSPSRATTLLARVMGYRPMRGSFEAVPGDTVDVEITLCSMRLMLQQVTTSEQAGVSVDRAATDQQDSVDRGDIAKVVGRFLVILRRGRLFTIDLGHGGPKDHKLRATGEVNVFENGLDPWNRRYQKLYAYGNRIIVFGRGVSQHDYELAFFTLSGDGQFGRDATYQIRMTCEYNCEPRVVAGRLVFNAWFLLSLKAGEPYTSLPMLRRWTSTVTANDYRSLVTPRSIYRFPNDSGFGRFVAVHAVTMCDLRSPELACAAQALIAPRGEAFYVSPTAAYLWTEASPFGRERTPGDSSTSVLARFSFEGSAPRALRVSGNPDGDLSFREEDGRFLKVLVRLDRQEHRPSAREHSDSSSGALVRISLSEFGDGSRSASRMDYRRLPMVEGNSLENRFFGKWLMYGGGYTDIYMSESMFSSTLFAVRVDGGDPLRLTLPHTIDRIHAIDRGAIVLGGNYEGSLVVSALNLANKATMGGQHALAQPMHEYLEMLASSVRDDGAGSGILGMTVRRRGRSAEGHWDPAKESEESTEVLFLRVAPTRIKEIGTIKVHENSSVDDSTDACRGSCEGWFDNVRALFVRERIFVLLGYDLVELRMSHGRVVALQRLDFSPQPARSEQK